MDNTVYYRRQVIDLHNTWIIFDEQETGQRSKTAIAIKILQSLKKQSIFDLQWSLFMSFIGLLLYQALQIR